LAKVLICYLVQHSGHHSAARAIEKALHKLDPNVETMCVDLLAYTHPRWSAVLERTYMTTIRRTPEVWDALYDNTWLEYLTRKIRRLIQRGNSKGLRGLMDGFNPDVAICTQAHPLAVLNAYSSRHRPDLPLWGVVTDYVPHRFWVAPYPGNHNYFVPRAEAARRLVWLGVERRRIYVAGIPISPSFVEERHTDISRNNGRRVLVMGGSRGLGARYRTIKHLDLARGDFTLDIVTGTNRRLRRKLVRNRASFKHPIRIRGYVKDVVALMYRASLLISKPGGATVAEAAAAGLPMVLVRPLPGQERGNTDVLVSHGCALHLKRDRDVAPVVTTLLGNEELLSMMRERALRFGRKDAAGVIAEKVLSSLKDSKGDQG